MRSDNGEPYRDWLVPIVANARASFGGNLGYTMTTLPNCAPLTILLNAL